MPVPLLHTDQWVFLMCSDIKPSAKLSDRQQSNQLTDQGKHIVTPLTTAVEAYNMMLDEFGDLCWTDMMNHADHTAIYDVNMLKEHNIIKNLGE